MPTITDELVLNVAQPLRSFDQMETSIEGSVTAARRLSSEMETTQRSTAGAAREAQDFETRLRETERAAGRLSTEVSSMALSAGRAEGDFNNLAGALNLSEGDARRLAGSILEAQAAANRIQDSALQTARSLGLSEDEAARFASSMNRAARETRDAGDGADVLSNRFASIRSSVIGLVAGFGAFAAVRGIIRGLDDLVDSFIAFDQAINQSLAIVSNVTPEIRDQFEAVARTVGTTLRFSAAEAGEAFFFLASAGFDVAQQLTALPKVAQFAQAGMFDLSTATTLLADSQSALGLRLKDPIANMRELTRVSDVLTKANILSNAEVQQFAEALTNRAASAARTVGVELEEVVAVLAAFADQGLKGEAAGEAFAIVLRDLQTAALKNKDDFRDFGVAVFDAAGEIRPLADVVGDLEKAFDGLSDAQTRQALIDLGFQDRSVSNLLVLLGTSQAIRDYTTELQNAGGATQELADKQLLSLGARLDLAKQQFEDAKITLGEELVPAVEAFIAILPDVIEGVRNLAPAVEQVAAAFSDAAPAAASFASTIINFVESIPRSLGIIGDVINIQKEILSVPVLLLESLGDAVLGKFSEASQDLGDIGRNLGEIQTHAQSIQFGRLQQGLVDAIQEGDSAITALGDHLIALDKGEGGATFANIARLARTAGVETKDLAGVLRTLIANAQKFNLSATQVAGFELALLDMTETADRAAFQQQFLANHVTATATAVEQAATRVQAAASPFAAFFAEVDAVITGTGESFAEFVLGTSNEAFELLSALTPIEQLRVQLLALASDSEIAAQAFQDSLRPAFVDASQALIDFNDDAKVTADEYIRGLEEMGEANAKFALNIATVFAISPELAAAIQSLPREAGAILAAEFAANPQKALEAEGALLGTSTGLAETIRTLVAQAMSLAQSGNTEQLLQFTEFVTTLDVPGASQAIAAQLNEALPSAFDLLQIPEIDLTETGSLAGRSLIVGMQEAIAEQADGIRDAVEGATRSALQMQSPSRLMIGLGELAGESLLMGFVKVANRSVPILGGATFGSGGGGNVSNVTVNNTINHPQSPNLLSDAAALDQITGSAAAGLRAF